MTINEYITLVTETQKDVFCQEELVIEETFNPNSLFKLCTKNIPRERLILAWDMIVSAVAEKFCSCLEVTFFPEEVLDFLIENNIALSGLAHIRLPKLYLMRIYEKNHRYWEALENILPIRKN